MVVCCYEVVVVNMVEVVGKLIGCLGIVFVMCGFGVIYVLIGVYIVFQDLMLMILFVGQCVCEYFDCEVFQEIDYCWMFGQMVKWVVQIDDLCCIFEYLSYVFYVVMFGWFGLVVFVLLEDVLFDVCVLQFVVLVVKCIVVVLLVVQFDELCEWFVCVE